MCDRYTIQLSWFYFKRQLLFLNPLMREITPVLSVQGSSLKRMITMMLCASLDQLLNSKLLLRFSWCGGDSTLDTDHNYAVFSSTCIVYLSYSLQLSDIYIDKSPSKTIHLQFIKIHMMLREAGKIILLFDNMFYSCQIHIV